jgi:hypothetical protein
MRRMSLVPLAVLLLMSTGCEDRPPLSRAQAVSNAYNLQLRDGLNWGDAIETVAPGPADDRGKRWWQMRYRPGADGEVRIMLVDAESGWARRPPAGYVPRLPPAPKITGEQALTVAEGSHILVVAKPRPVADPDQRRTLDQEVLRLNALATNTGLTPLFSLREGRDQQVSIVYGWKNDRGIERQERVVEWLTARTPYRDVVWEDLLPKP